MPLAVYLVRGPLPPSTPSIRPPATAIEKPSQPLPVGTPAKHDNRGREPRAAQAAPASAAAAATPAAPNQLNGLYQGVWTFIGWRLRIRRGGSSRYSLRRSSRSALQFCGIP